MDLLRIPEMLIGLKQVYFISTDWVKIAYFEQNVSLFTKKCFKYFLQALHFLQSWIWFGSRQVVRKLPKNWDCVEEKTIKMEISPLLQIQLFPQTLVMELLLSGFNLLTLFPIVLFFPAQPNLSLSEIHCSSWPKKLLLAAGIEPRISRSQAHIDILRGQKLFLDQK